MSYQLTAWAVKQRTGSATKKSVLMALANAATHHTSTCEPKIELLAEETELNERTVRRALDDLAAMGLITREMRHKANGHRAGYIYSFPRLADTPPGSDLALPDSLSGGLPGTVSGQELEQEDLEQDLEEPNGSSRSEETAIALTREVAPPDPLAQPSPTPRSMPRVVDRAAVTISEAGLAVKVLTAYNELTGQAYASKEWLSKIVMRIREHPELGLDEHRAVLGVTLADPWWKGRPTPSVVYGNAAQFERCLDAMLAAPLRNGDGAVSNMKFGRRDVSAGEMLAAAERLEQDERKEIERATE